MHLLSPPSWGTTYPLFDVALGTAISLVAFLLTTELPKATKNRRPLKQVAAADEVTVLPVSAKHGFSYKVSCVGVAPIIALPHNCSGTTYKVGRGWSRTNYQVVSGGATTFTASSTVELLSHKGRQLLRKRPFKIIMLKQ